MEVVSSIIKTVLKSYYEYFFVSVVMTILAADVFMHIRNNGFKTELKELKNTLKNDVQFRRLIYFVGYTIILLFCTLFCREFRGNPLLNVAGVWSFHDDKGMVSTDQIQNLVLFMPYIYLLYNAAWEKIFKTNTKFYMVIFKSFAIGAASSLFIELSQLLFRLGTFQLSDLTFNTLGAIIGGIVYYIVVSVKK